MAGKTKPGRLKWGSVRVKPNRENPDHLEASYKTPAGAGALFLAQNAFETDALQTDVVPVVNIVLLGIGTVGMYLVGRARGKI